MKLSRALFSILIVAVLGLGIWQGYQFSWTGFPTTQTPPRTVEPAKTLWDWLDLLLVPAFLAIGAWMIEASRRRSDKRTERDRQQQKTLENYFEVVSELLLADQLDDANAPAATVVRIRTLAALRSLDGGRKAELLQFLYESDLIGQPPIIQLNGADFSQADLEEATLSGAELRGVYFKGASFRKANLRDADLRGSSFEGANMTYARVEGANFVQADFTGMDTKGTDFNSANTEQTDLSDE